jgi:ribosomal protein S18 acetylase RimI-like enzyme
MIHALGDWSARNATSSDLAAVLELWRTAGVAPGVSDTHDGVAARLRHDPEGLLIADCDGVPIGSLIAVWDGWRGSFYRLAVRPERRREGIAAALLGEGERRLRARGAQRLTAIVADQDPGAMEFWRAAGYRRQADRTRFVLEP